jgi:hypothetical protein
MAPTEQNLSSEQNEPEAALVNEKAPTAEAEAHEGCGCGADDTSDAEAETATTTTSGPESHFASVMSGLCGASGKSGGIAAAMAHCARMFAGAGSAETSEPPAASESAGSCTNREV